MPVKRLLAPMTTAAAIMALVWLPANMKAETVVDEKTGDPPALTEDTLAEAFNDLFAKITPKLQDITKDMGQAMQLMAPALADLAALVDDIDHYDRPERLENGDILIRRKADAPPPPAIGEDLKRFMPPHQDFHRQPENALPDDENETITPQEIEI